MGLFLNSCYYDSHPVYEEIVVDDDDIPTEVSFENDIEPLFIKCTGCHGGSTSPDLRTGNAYSSLVPTYVTANNADGSRLYNYLPGNGHHEVGLSYSNTEIALIKAWINQGANNN